MNALKMVGWTDEEKADEACDRPDPEEGTRGIDYL